MRTPRANTSKTNGAAARDKAASPLRTALIAAARDPKQPARVRGWVKQLLAGDAKPARRKAVRT